MNVGDVVITTGAVRLDGASTHYAPIEYPAVAHHEVVAALIKAARETGVPVPRRRHLHDATPSIRGRSGTTPSPATFRAGFQGITEEWRRLTCSTTRWRRPRVLTLASAMGLRGGCVAGVVVNRTRSESMTKADLDLGEGNAVRVAAAAAALLI